MERKQNTKGNSLWGISSAGRAPALHAGGQEFESPILHHLKQLEQLKSEPKGSFLMLSMHLSFEEIIADLNSANPTSAISFLASFTRFSIVANGSLKTTLTFLSFAVADRYVSLIILATSSAESSVAGKLAFRHKSRILSPVSKKVVLG